MKKIILTSILTLLILPSIALAAWWNPVSWFDNWSFIFKKKDTSSEILEKRIVELENQLEETNDFSNTDNEILNSAEEERITSKSNIVSETSIPQKNIELENTLQIQAQIDMQKILEENIKEQDKLDEINRKNNSLARIAEDIKELNSEYTDNINSLKTEYLELEKEYLQKKNDIWNIKGQSQIQANAQISNLSQQYELKFSALDIKEQEIILEYQKQYKILSDKYDELNR